MTNAESKLTIQQVKKMFKQGMKGLPKRDWIKDEWVDFLNMLYKDGFISEEQSLNWKNDFNYKT